MILNEEQIESIQQKITYAVKYSETFDEVYDHVLSTINAMPKSGEKTEKLIDDIIDQDFGGRVGLVEMEKSHQKVMRKQIRHKQLQYMRDCFEWPSILLIAVLTIIIYYFLNDANNNVAFRNSIGVITYLPFVFVTLTSLMNMYILRGQKLSVKYSEIFNISGTGYLVYSLIKLLLKYILGVYQSLIVQHIGNALATLLFVLLVAYTVAFFRLYKAEFKMNIAR